MRPDRPERTGGEPSGGRSRRLTPELAEAAEQLHGLYRRGLFPMADPRGSGVGQQGSGSPGDGSLGAVGWYDPDPRALLPLIESEGLHLPRRLVRTVRQGRYRVSTDEAFDRVVGMCGDPGREGAWIDEQIRAIAGVLHLAGHAHSVEAWDVGGRLVGGVYGVSVPGRAGPIFCAESMVTDFARGRDAGKVCLVHLVRHLAALGYAACDVQMANEHTLRFGVREVERERYHAMLRPEERGVMPWGALAEAPG